MFLILSKMNHPRSPTNQKAWAKFAQEQLSYLLFKPLEQNPWATAGSGTQLRKRVGVRSGSHVLQSGLMVLH